MRTLGLIGGMSWESTALYYQAINRGVARALGGLHSARLHLVSLNFADIARRQREDDWDGMTRILVDAARTLEQNGVDAVMICTNTMHKLAPQVEASIEVPLLHIGDVTAQAVVDAGIDTVALLGTRFTMEQAFYTERLSQRGLRCVVPPEAGRAEVHRIIFEELCRGRIEPSSREALQRIVAGLYAQGAQGVVLGCTELTMLLGPDDVGLPVFDTTALHAEAGVAFALAEELALA